jgi:hypothetical protein
MAQSGTWFTNVQGTEKCAASGSSTTDKKNRMGASLTHLLHFNDHGEYFLEQIITGDETWDFHLFPNTKKHLRAKRFKSQDDVRHEVQTWLRCQDSTFCQQGFEKWISRLDKCLNREGDYVEN